LHARFQDNTSSDDFSPLAIRNTENRHFAYRRMIENSGLNLATVHIFTAGDDHVLLAVSKCVGSCFRQHQTAIKVLAMRFFLESIRMSQRWSAKPNHIVREFVEFSEGNTK
jgi:hypothetical protein